MTFTAYLISVATGYMAGAATWPPLKARLVSLWAKIKAAPAVLRAKITKRSKP